MKASMEERKIDFRLVEKRGEGEPDTGEEVPRAFPAKRPKKKY
jgi:ribonuclease R